MATNDSPSVTFAINFIHPCHNSNSWYCATLNCADCRKNCWGPCTCWGSSAYGDCALKDRFYADFHDVVRLSRPAIARDIYEAGRYVLVGDALGDKLFKPGIVGTDSIMVGVMLNVTPSGITEIENFPMEFVKKHKVR